jgi:hypothetical protein
MSHRLKLCNTHIVHRDDDEEFGLTTMFDLSKTEAFLHKLVGIAGDGGISTRKSDLEVLYLSLLPRLFHFIESRPWQNKTKGIVSLKR